MSLQFYSWAYIQRKTWPKMIHAMFIAALFTMAKTWKQPKCPSTEKWKKKMWYTYQIRSDHISHSVVSDSLRPHELQHARPPCPSPTPGVHLDSRPSSQ